MKIDQFEQLYAEHADGLLAFLVYRTGDRGLAEEVLADTFERVLRSRSRFDSRRGKAKTWVYSIALNRLRDVLRKHEAEQRAMDRTRAVAVEAGDFAAEIDDRSSLTAAIGDLDELEREALSLRYGADLSVPEIAKVLGVKVSTAEGRIYRGLRNLREALDETPPRG